MYLQTYCSDDLARLCSRALPLSSVESSTGSATPAPDIVLLDAVDAVVSPPTKSPLFEVALEHAAAVVATPAVGIRREWGGSVFTSRLASISPTGRTKAPAAPDAHGPTLTAPVGTVSARNDGDPADLASVVLLVANLRPSPEGAHAGAGKGPASGAATPERVAVLPGPGVDDDDEPHAVRACACGVLVGVLLAEECLPLLLGATAASCCFFFFFAAPHGPIAGKAFSLLTLGT